MVTTPIGSYNDSATSATVQSDGKIVVGGNYESIGTNYYGSALTRFNTDGSLDTSFGSSGKVAIRLSGCGDERLNAIAIQSDGKIVTAGLHENRCYGYDFGVARFDTDGKLDSTFGSDGKATVVHPFCWGRYCSSHASSLALQADGKIVLAGGGPYAPNDPGTPYGFHLARFNGNGSLDPDFGTNGTLTTDIGTGGHAHASAVVIQSDGKIVAAGIAKDSGGNYDFALARYLQNTCDSTPPVITPTVGGTLGKNGWYVSNVEVSWQVTDAESEISASDGCDEQSVTSDTAGTTFTCTATSAGGTNSSSVTIKRDATPPTASASAGPPANLDGWRRQNVTVTFSGTDALSGGVTCDPPVVLSSEGANQIASGYCYDAAGNQSLQTSVSGINLDKTAPTISIASPTDGATYTRNLGVNANFICGDVLSDVRSCIGTVVNSQPIDTSKKVKNAKFTVTAIDKAGNMTKQTVSYTVTAVP